MQDIDVAFDWIFNGLGYNKIYSKALASRKDIQHILEGWMWHHEGTLRDNLFWNGAMHDEDIYSLLAREYDIARKGIK